MATYTYSLASAASAAMMVAAAQPAEVDPIPVDAGRNIHRRGRFKPNARRQKGRKTLPRRAK